MYFPDLMSHGKEMMKKYEEGTSLITEEQRKIDTNNTYDEDPKQHYRPDNDFKDYEKAINNPKSNNNIR